VNLERLLHDAALRTPHFADRSEDSRAKHCTAKSAVAKHVEDDVAGDAREDGEEDRFRSDDDSPW